MLCHNGNSMLEPLSWEVCRSHMLQIHTWVLTVVFFPHPRAFLRQLGNSQAWMHPKGLMEKVKRPWHPANPDRAPANTLSPKIKIHWGDPRIMRYAQTSHVSFHDIPPDATKGLSCQWQDGRNVVFFFWDRLWIDSHSVCPVLTCQQPGRSGIASVHIPTGW